MQSLKKKGVRFYSEAIGFEPSILLTLKPYLLRRRSLLRRPNNRRKFISQKSTTIVGASRVITEIISMVDTVSATDARVLITGSNGAGKELIARQLHDGSPRKKSSFIEVNCAAILRS